MSYQKTGAKLKADTLFSYFFSFVPYTLVCVCVCVCVGGWVQIMRPIKKQSIHLGTVFCS
jgi:hypothetical protein